MLKPYYITTTLPYVNSDPHIGFAMEIIRADTIARYKKMLGHEVFFNTGTDEHGMKLWESAKKFNKDVKVFVDEHAEKFRGLLELLDISKDIHFIRTTDEHHGKSAQALWKICDERGFIYKGKYSAKYCVGCELEKTDSELDEKGHCPLHPNSELELIDEENYFFALSKAQPLLEDYYKNNPKLVIPDFRYNEVKAFLERGLQDFSISRSVEKMPWGIPVPNDDKQVMYVWFDALTNYISTLGWPNNSSDDESGENNFEKFWENGEKVQYCGKDNTRQQALTWQAMLLSAGISGTNHIIINGFINSGGQKMSKSIGNVISPYDVIGVFQPVAGELASDVLRYVLLRHTSSFEDSDFTMEAMIEYYNAGLANGLGNLSSRILTMAEQYEVKNIEIEQNKFSDKSGFSKNSKFPENHDLNNYEIGKYLDMVWSKIQKLDRDIQEKAPFQKIKNDPSGAKLDIHDMIGDLAIIAQLLTPALPKTAEKILSLIKESKKPAEPLFKRI